MGSSSSRTTTGYYYPAYGPSYGAYPQYSESFGYSAAPRKRPVLYVACPMPAMNPCAGLGLAGGLPLGGALGMGGGLPMAGGLSLGAGLPVGGLGGGLSIGGLGGGLPMGGLGGGLACKCVPISGSGLGGFGSTTAGFNTGRSFY